MQHLYNNNKNRIYSKFITTADSNEIQMTQVSTN